MLKKSPVLRLIPLAAGTLFSQTGSNGKPSEAKASSIVTKSKPEVAVMRPLDSPVVKRIHERGEPARYAPPGYLIFRTGSRLVAQSFDVARGSPTGEPISIVDAFNGRYANFSVSSNGACVFYRTAANTRLVWLDRNGKPVGMPGEGQQYTNPAIS